MGNGRLVVVDAGSVVVVVGCWAVISGRVVCPTLAAALGDVCSPPPQAANNNAAATTTVDRRVA
jgi:hypothetical protein